MNTQEWIDYQSQFDLPAAYFQDIPEKTTKHCVIVEPRAHERLVLVIKNFMYLLQKKEWGLVIFHSSDNERMLKEGLEGWSNVIMIKSLEGSMAVHDYNNLMCSPPFWKELIRIGSHHSLIFQVDTVLLKDNIDDFLEYDYVGAPWCVRWLDMDIGNGGLSLRNVWKMMMITQQCSRTAMTPFGERFLGNEDIFFSFHLKQQTANLPSVETAKRFSVETIYYEDPCGMHQPHIGRFPNYDAFATLLSKRYNISG